MVRAAFTTLGCKVNQYETQRILESFESAGFQVVPFDSPADVYVVNTCSVTSIAESKSRYTLRRALRHSPDAKVVATGCAAQMALNQGETLSEAHLVVPNPDKLDTLAHVLRAYPELTPTVRAPRSLEPSGRTRATLKVQDGCSVHCSYCSIPFTRPGMRSRPWRDVLAEAQNLAAQGYKEIVLTGVLIGSYSRGTGSEGPDFEDLVRTLADRGGVPRIRISSIEVRQVTERLIRLLEEGLVVPHLHVPLQSGDDQVLRDMNRPYSRRDYLNLVSELRRRVPRLCLTTDILVGFPTEDDAAFGNTVDLAERTGFAKIHAFRFSPRHGTPADAWGDPVPVGEKQRRSSRLAEVSSAGAERFALSCRGRTLRVLVEGKQPHDGMLEGLSDEYLTVRFAGPRSLHRDLVTVAVSESVGGIGYGEIVHSANLALAPV